MKSLNYILLLALQISSKSLSGCVDQSQPAVKTVEIKSFSFQPASITVPAGTTIIWMNRDAVAHTVTADDGSFKSPSIAGDGGKFEHTFSEVGTYKYHCTPHPSMKGEVVVTSASVSSSPASPRPKVKLELVAEGFTAPMNFLSAGDGTGECF